MLDPLWWKTQFFIQQSTRHGSKAVVGHLIIGIARTMVRKATRTPFSDMGLTADLADGNT
ncbi:hypothetical protein [Pseudomaricurvus hydrocarbonicus]|uniref:hypothetical protein n=1 Tax=Pseudomaricurvus hydrocarbonicus TaxID=1470433 RepID=UPI001422CAB8|nr:hypothetical protein [Aestuariicella hydrocarbonica]